MLPIKSRYFHWSHRPGQLFVTLTADFGIVIGIKGIYKVHMAWVSTEIVRRERPYDELSESVPVSAWVTIQHLSQRVKNQRDGHKQTTETRKPCQHIPKKRWQVRTQHKPEGVPLVANLLHSCDRQRLCPPWLSHVNKCPTIQGLCECGQTLIQWHKKTQTI